MKSEISITMQIPVIRRGVICDWALVDAADYEQISCYQWYRVSGGGHYDRPHYACRFENGKPVLMHREIMGLPRNDHIVQVDHVNRNGLDNRRVNLRIATHAQNMQNRKVHRHSRSGYRNVSWDERCQKWRVRVTLGGVRRRIGDFDDKVAADLFAQEWRMKNMPFAVS